MIRKKPNRPQHDAVNVNNDLQMVRESLRQPQIKQASYDVNCKNVGLTETQKDNLPKLGLSLNSKTREVDVLRILRKQKTFINIFEQGQLKNQSRSNKVVSQLK